MNEEEKVELKMRDAFGKAQYISALPRKKIEERLDDIWENLGIYVREACKKHFFGRDTEILLDLETGKVAYTMYSPGNEPIFDPSIVLYTIGHDIWANTSWKHIFDPEELKEAKEMLENDEIEEYEEYAEKKEIDLDERLSVCVEQWIMDEDPDFVNVRNALDEIYGREREVEEA